MDRRELLLKTLMKRKWYKEVMEISPFKVRFTILERICENLSLEEVLKDLSPYDRSREGWEWMDKERTRLRWYPGERKHKRRKR